MINPLLDINVRKILVKEATIYKCQVGDTTNAQINQTRLYPINHISWNGIKRALLYNYLCTVDELYVFLWSSQTVSLTNSFTWWKTSRRCYFSHVLMTAGKYSMKNFSVWSQGWLWLSWQQTLWYLTKKKTKHQIYGGKSLWIVSSVFFTHSIMKCKWINPEIDLRDWIKIYLY